MRSTAAADAARGALAQAARPAVATTPVPAVSPSRALMNSPAALAAAGERPATFVAHDLDEDNLELLRTGAIDLVLVMGELATLRQRELLEYSESESNKDTNPSRYAFIAKVTEFFEGTGGS